MQSRIRDSLPQLQQALVLRSALEGPRSAAVAKTTLFLGHASQKLGNAPEAIMHFSEVRSVLAGVPGMARLLADATKGVARVHEDEGRLDAALELYEEVFDLQKHTLGWLSMDTAQTLLCMAFVLSLDAAALDRSMGYYRQVLEIQTELVGRVHFRVAKTLIGMGIVLTKQLQYAAAQAAFSDALEIQEATIGLMHRDVNWAYRWHICFNQLYLGIADGMSVWACRYSSK